MSTQSDNGYMLIFRSTDWYKGLSPEEMQQVGEKWMAWFNRLKDEGKCVGCGHCPNAALRSETERDE
jgi:hypothetical protein